MKVLCFISSLGNGGAERQLATLAAGLIKRGHEVRFLVYHPHDHFLPLLQEAGISCQVIPPCSVWLRALAVRRILRRSWQDVVLAFMEAPCLYAELATIPSQRWGLVAGERTSNPNMGTVRGRFIRYFHRLADSVVANSHTTRLMLAKGYPWLKSKLITIYNTVDLQLMRPSGGDARSDGIANPNEFRIIVAARRDENKNMLGLVKALLRLKSKQSSRKIVVDWFGSTPERKPELFRQVERFITEKGIADSIRFQEPTMAIQDEISRADAVGLFSFYEGLPNAICEGMACGKPILLSNVCDAGNLVRDGKNGFLCDPGSPESMANALGRLAALSSQERWQMGSDSRKMAEDLFAANVVLDYYERILEAAARHAPVPTDCTWPVKVPESAVATVAQWANERRFK